MLSSDVSITNFILTNIIALKIRSGERGLIKLALSLTLLTFCECDVG